LHSEESSTSAHLESILVSKQLKMEGFLYHRWLNRWFEGVHQMLQWIKEVHT
jgi:NADPH-dependent curcumin reductase CurA